jgi:hypothetical protein
MKRKALAAFAAVLALAIVASAETETKVVCKTASSTRPMCRVIAVIDEVATTTGSYCSPLMVPCLAPFTQDNGPGSCTAQSSPSPSGVAIGHKCSVPPEDLFDAVKKK